MRLNKSNKTFTYYTFIKLLHIYKHLKITFYRSHFLSARRLVFRWRWIGCDWYLHVIGWQWHKIVYVVYSKTLCFNVELHFYKKITFRKTPFQHQGKFVRWFKMIIWRKLYFYKKYLNSYFNKIFWGLKIFFYFMISIRIFVVLSKFKVIRVIRDLSGLNI